MYHHTNHSRNTSDQKDPKDLFWTSVEDSIKLQPYYYSSQVRYICWMRQDDVTIKSGV